MTDSSDSNSASPAILFHVDPQGVAPVYRQLMDQVKLYVASGQLKAGDELPSTRSLSSELGINPMTISKAFAYLEKEGIVQRRPGRPLVVKLSDKDHAEAGREVQLRERLLPIVTTVRQLRIPPEEALRIFKDLLHNSPTSNRDKPSKETE